MNSNKSGSNYTFDFDLGINSNKSNKPLNAQKPNPYSSNPTMTSSSSSWQQSNTNKPSWTHQPAAQMTSSTSSLNGPTSMVGDITGKSWNSSGSSGNGIGIANIASKNSSLFSDLLGGSKINSGSSSNVPLKNVGSVASQTGAKSGGFSMSGMAGALPKTGYGNYNTNKDPFGGLVDLAKGSGGLKTGSKTSVPAASGGDEFGGFQNAAKSGGNGFTGTGTGSGSQSTFGDFGFGGMGNQPSVQSSSFDEFGFGGMGNQASVQSSVGNDFDVLFPTSSAGNNASKGSDNFANEQFVGAEDWGFESDIGGGGDVGGTTELEGLPPPPAGVTSSSAKSKGMDNYKAGQYPDAIKWLSWAVILLEKGGDKSGAMEVLSSRASCYKEVGEYKKAVADCSKVLEQDGKNVSVLVQRALLYESMEKYKLGAEDLRTVMNIDPGNRVARSTIHRLTKLAS